MPELAGNTKHCVQKHTTVEAFCEEYQGFLLNKKDIFFMKYFPGRTGGYFPFSCFIARNKSLNTTDTMPVPLTYDLKAYSFFTHIAVAMVLRCFST